MPGLTRDLLAETTLGTAAQSVSFSGFSTAYRDLIVVAKIVANSGNPNAGLWLNSTTSNHSRFLMAGTGNGTMTAQAASNGTVFTGTAPYTWSIAEWQIFNYTSTTIEKPWLCYGTRNQIGALNVTSVGAGNFNTTAAITNIEVNSLSSDFFGVGSTFRLYGLIA